MTPEHELIARLRIRLAELHRDIGRPPPAAQQTWAGDETGPGTPVPAAVLVPIVDTPSGPHLVLTRRAGSLRTHGGEIAFPGGRIDPDEMGRDAALREAHEELGIDPASVEILGHLPRISTVVTGYMIAPWVGIVPQSALQPNPSEIAEVLEVSLELLLQPGVRRDQRFIRKGRMSTSPAYDIGTHIVWGATARILAGLLDLLADHPHDAGPAGHPHVEDPSRRPGNRLRRP